MSTWVPEPHAPTCPSLPSPILSRVLIQSPYPPPFETFDHILAAVEDVVGHHGYHYWRDR